MKNADEDSRIQMTNEYKEEWKMKNTDENLRIHINNEKYRCRINNKDEE